MSVVTRGEVSLNYLRRFKCIAGGQWSYLISVPEFNERMSTITKSGKPVNERVILDVLKQLYEDVENDEVNPAHVSLPTLRNCIRRLERSIATPADE